MRHRKMQSIPSIIKELKATGMLSMANRITKVMADTSPGKFEEMQEKKKFVELVPIKKNALLRMTKKFKKPLGLLVYELGLKQGHRVKPASLMSPIKYLHEYENNLDFYQKNNILIFRKEEPFQVLNEYYKHKVKRGEPRVSLTPILVKHSDLDL